MNCEICDNTFVHRWTDTHGIGACVYCGAPYKIYHYDDENKRVDKPPELSIKKDWVELTKKYWNEAKRNVAPGAYNFPGSSYEVATQEDFDSINEFFNKHAPKENEKCQS